MEVNISANVSAEAVKLMALINGTTLYTIGLGDG